MCVSIIIPVHNSERYLKECIESAINQSFSEIELLCIDGGSTDASFEIIDEMRKRDNRIKYIFDSNTSYGHKINAGVRNAKGKYIAILESDDVMSVTMIESLYNAAEETGADVVDADFYELFSYKERSYRNIVKKYSHNQAYNCLISRRGGIPQEEFKAIWTALYRKDFLTGHNIWLNESQGASYQDSSFVFLVNLLADTFYHLDIPFYQYRVDNVGSSVKDDKKIFEIIGEYEFLKNDLIKREIKDRETWTLYYKSKYDSFYWNYRRLSQNAREIFLDKYLQELKRDSEERLIDREMFGGDVYHYTFGIIDDREGFVNEVSTRDRKPSLIKLLEDLNPRRVHSPMLASQQTNDERSESRADTPQLAAGSFIGIEDRKLVIFGAGVWGTKVIGILEQSNCNLCAVCDNSKLLQGTVKCGYNIISVEEAVRLFPDAVYLIVNRKYSKDMKAQLLKENIQDENVMIFQ